MVVVIPCDFLAQTWRRGLFKLPQEDDAVERMRLAKMLRLPGEEGVGLPGDGVDCHQIVIMFCQLASLGDLHGYPILVKHPPI